jgi:hypothetical protein
MSELLAKLVWPALALIFFIVYRKQIRRVAEAVIGRVERGDEVTIATWITLGKSTGKLKAPSAGDLITDDHLALIHRSWRVEHRDKDFGGQQMYQIHIVLFGEKAALDRVEYVVYHLDPSYPNPVRAGGSRENSFELKELANGYSLVRAEVKIGGQDETIYLSRFIDLMDESPKLKGTYC